MIEQLLDRPDHPHPHRLTGRRVGELLGAKWTDVDLDKGIMTLPQTKVGERQFVYLNEPAAAVLRTLPHIEGNPYILAGAAPGKPLNFYRRAWNRILKRTDIDPFPPHGLRHNYASTLVAAGVPLETVGLVITDGRTTLVTEDMDADDAGGGDHTPQEAKEEE